MVMFGAQIGRNAYSYAEEYDERRITRAELSMSEASKKARAFLRSKKLAQNDVYEATDGLLYDPGIADWCKYKFYTNILLLKL